MGLTINMTLAKGRTVTAKINKSAWSVFILTELLITHHQYIGYLTSQ